MNKKLIIAANHREYEDFLIRYCGNPHDKNFKYLSMPESLYGYPQDTPVYVVGNWRNSPLIKNPDTMRRLKDFFTFDGTFLDRVK